MNKFKIGDRVVVISGGIRRDFYSVGNVGTALSNTNPDGYVSVLFDRGQIGVDYRDCFNTVLGCWYVDSDNLTLTEENKRAWYETEEGKERLSNQQPIENQFRYDAQEDVVHRVGNTYVSKGRGLNDAPWDDDEYLLVQTSVGFVALIHLPGGNRWVDAKRVKNPRALTDEEWKKIGGGGFSLVKKR